MTRGYIHETWRKVKPWRDYHEPKEESKDEYADMDTEEPPAKVANTEPPVSAPGTGAAASGLQEDRS